MSRAWALLVLSALGTLCWEMFIVQGGLADVVRTRYPSVRPQFGL